SPLKQCIVRDFGFLAWILTMTTAGLNEWRLWRVGNATIISSGEAWVGIWRMCFYSHVLPDMENCRSISISDSFLPVEIPVAQVLMMLAAIFGLAANICAAVAVRMAYFSVEDRRSIRLVFLLAGALYLLTGTSSLVPLAWNMNSVLKNSTIDFPPEFQIPAPPVSQRVGSAIGVGLCASVATLLSGLDGCLSTKVIINFISVTEECSVCVCVCVLVASAFM
uniref:Claudin 34 n=1 Tax=Oreochromis niloticus TaxID=8128 RepID=I3J541_ORENI